MKPTTHALRAITAVIVRRYLTIAAIIGGSILIILYGLVIWALTQNSWWGLCFIVLLPLTTVAIGVFVGIRWSLARLQPRELTRGEQRQIAQFSKQITELSDRVRTPWPWLALHMGMDILRGKESTMLHKTIDQSTELKTSFQEIVKLFK